MVQKLLGFAADVSIVAAICTDYGHGERPGCPTSGIGHRRPGLHSADMKRLSSLSIHSKLMLIVMTTTCAALLVALVTLSVFDQIGFKRKMRDDAVTLARIVANNSSAALMFSDPRPAEEAIQAFQAD